MHIQRCTLKNHYVPSGHTDGNFMYPVEILCAQVKRETWIIKKMFNTSAHEHHSLTYLNSFSMIPNTWQFDHNENDFLQKIMYELKTDNIPTGHTTS